MWGGTVALGNKVRDGGRTSQEIPKVISEDEVQADLVIKFKIPEMFERL